MKKLIVGLTVIAFLWSCDTKEKVSLQQKVDSLNVELKANSLAEEKLNEVGVLIDSIDASRKSLQLEMIEGKPYSDYIARLREINTYVQQTEKKLSDLESSSNKTSKASARSIRRLKADLEKRSQEIVALQLQLVTLTNENRALWAKGNSKDSILSIKDQVIKLKEGDIASLENLINETQSENKEVVAGLYFAQAEALELAASRTHFAPRKKKETKREALDLYKLSLTLGKVEAVAKIDDLTKELNYLLRLTQQSYKTITRPDITLYTTSMKPEIGISNKDLNKSTVMLSTTLADEMTLYIKTRKFHWNVYGESFMELHKIFQNQYTELEEIIDQVAERINKLGSATIGTMKEFTKFTRLTESPEEYPSQTEILKELLQDHETIIKSLRKDIEESSGKNGDVGTTDFLTGIMEQHETTAWTLRRYFS